MNHKVSKIALIIAGAAVVVLLAIFVPKVFNILAADTKEEQAIDNEQIIEKSNRDSVQQLEQVLNNDKLAGTVACFYYPDSSVQAFECLEENGHFIYMLMETEEDYTRVKGFYNNKNIQYIWSKSQLYETSLPDLEEQFLDDSEKASTSKYSYFSNGKDSVVNILINGSSSRPTRIMLIYWEL